MIPRDGGDRDRDGSGVRRLPLSMFDRQMLTKIQDSLNHLHNNEAGASADPGIQSRTELSQSTPNLLEKSTPGGQAKPARGFAYNVAAMAKIRNDLRLFQNDNGNTSNSSTQGSDDAGDTSSVNRQFLQQIVMKGYDSQPASQALLLSGNKSVEAALEILSKSHISEGKNGINYGNYSKVKRKPSFEMKYLPTQSNPSSDTTSIRSDSPSLSSITSRQIPLEMPNPHRIITSQATNIMPVPRQVASSPVTNGDGLAPPVPPRAPLMPPTADTENVMTKHPISVTQQFGVSNPAQQRTGAPHGQVQEIIKQMTPAPRETVMSSMTRDPPQTHIVHSTKVQQLPPPQRQSAESVTSTSQRGMSPITVNQHLVNSQHYPIGQQSGVTISHNGNANVSNSGPRVTILYNKASQPPPPYHSTTQVHQPSRVVHIHGKNNEHSHMISSHVPDPRPKQSYEAQITVNNSSNASTSASDSVHIISFPGRTAPSPLPVAMPAWGAKQPPIFMQSVKSQKVNKPVLQTATVPLSPTGPSVSGNYISSVQTQINTPSPQPQPAAQTNQRRPLQIQITRHPAQNGNLAPEQIPQHQQQQQPVHGQSAAHRPTIQIHIQNQSGYPQYAQNHRKTVQIQNMGAHYDPYSKSASDTPGSNSRSDSPVSRQTNQSPMSVLSTTSTPSTNSDIPDKPPPAYPGRPLTIQTHVPQGQPVQIVQPIPQYQELPVHHGIPVTQPQYQPPIPPRVPLQPQNKAPPPPLPQLTTQPPPLPPKNMGQQLPPYPSSPSDLVCSSNDPNEETDTETLSTVSDTSQEKTRCTSPMPERKTGDKEKDALRRDACVKHFSSQAYKFYIEQHVENVIKAYQQRQKRWLQLESEMATAKLSEAAQVQVRDMMRQKESNYLRLKRAKMEKNLFQKIKTLGVGAFGEVTLCRKKNSNQLYAMKTLAKSDVLKRNQVAHVKAERDILAEADNEWVVKLYYSFQDRDNLYFVMDYVPGGDLMGLLIKFGIFEEPLARFYIAELVLAIESVHRMGFIHRDIKPDNILIDSQGHIKLTDFGLCTGFRWTHNSKYYQKDGVHARQDSMDINCSLTSECNCEKYKPLERRRHRDQQRCLAHSLVGTPNYIAPEVMLRTGYTSCCDWWSVGVILYEMLVGQPPFYAPTPAETQHKVIHWEKTLMIPPEAGLQEAASNLILRLCCGDDVRLGKNGTAEIKKHPFFSEITFTGLRQQPALYKPQIKHKFDTSNFDPVDSDRLHNSDSDNEYNRMIDHPENGRHPEHAFYEFTFHRFFDYEPDPNGTPVYV